MDQQIIEIHAGLVAWYETGPVAGSVPHTVVFTDRSVGEVQIWLWDFGDSNTSFQQHPSHTYQLPGTYTVTLTVSGPSGSDVYARQRLIRGLPAQKVYLPLVMRVR
jgi:PKD repeat protein